MNNLEILTLKEIESRANMLSNKVDKMTVTSKQQEVEKAEFKKIAEDIRLKANAVLENYFQRQNKLK